MSETIAVPLADTSDMVGLHRVFRDALDAGPLLVGRVAPDDHAGADFVGSYYDNVLRLLHVHHDAEDMLMTPRLVQRCTADEATEVTRIAGQHERVMADLDAAEHRVGEWRADPTPRANAALIAALATLGASLTPHLDEEERVVLPIAGRHLNAAEWGEMPAHGMQAFDGDKLWLILGLVMEQMTPQQVADTESHMPPPLAGFWASSGRGMFTEYIGRLRS